ncbi:MAG: polyprenol monophosphomannose synthase [Candidatus Bathyarchaeia archaeon]|jgi:dolichol-phosphate mannosyltransferase
MSRVCVTIPTYNEHESISKLIPTLLRVFQDNGIDGWVLVVDDSSPDGTGDVVEALSREHPNIRVIHRKGKLGLGSAYKDAFREALMDRNTDLVVEMDADLSHDPTYLPAILQGAKRSGGVGLGSRYVKGGRIVGWPWRRKVVSWGANFLTRVILSLPVKDATSGYRAFTRDALTKIGYADAGTKAYAFQVEILYRCRRQSLSIEEVPITFYERQLGESKLSGGDMFDFLKTLLRLRFSF